MNEIYNILSILWNFLNRITATEREDKDLKKKQLGHSLFGRATQYKQSIT
jgi:hypothetical protein